MTNLEMVQEAIRVVGDVPAADLSAFVHERFGVSIEPKFIPLYLASIRDKLRVEAARRAARPAPLQPAVEAEER
jgi:hypothetical protein